MKKRFLQWAMVAFCAVQGFAQPKKAGELLFQLTPEARVDAVVAELEIPIRNLVPIAPRWRMYQLLFDPRYTELTPERLLRIDGVAAAQWNYEVSDRKIPNDPGWSEQRDMDLIKMPRAWETATGGKTPAGHTIVAAVFEQGMRKEHPDLAPNLWVYPGEIPGNNLDDDGNGYIDDDTGFDARLKIGNGGNGNSSSHGTSVCGIIGAKGDNDLAVSGVNWDVKMLPVLKVSTDDEIISAYYYAADMRRLYNESGGQKGAFIVATNASFGFDTAFPYQHPLWCPAFDSLGRLGILSVAATTNMDIDVEARGDMPTNCTSEFMVSVTEVSAQNGRRDPSGFGALSIDLGAPGAGSYTTVNRLINGPDTIWTGVFNGTSAACPHVTGAVALLYSLPCPGFTADALTDPAACARRVRDAILFNVTPEPTLKGLTTTGGRLQVAAAVQDVMDHCAGISGELEISSIRPNPVGDRLEVRYQTPDYGRYELQLFNTMGQLMYSEAFEPPFFSAKIKYIDFSTYPVGVYILRLGQGNRFITEKVVKVRGL